MGFTPLDGLMMGTRSGSIDPSLVSFLSQNPEEKMSLDEVMTMLNKKSGLLGVSGMTQDVRDLLHFIQTQQPGSSSSSSSCYSEYERAVLSIDMFCHRAAREMLGLTASLPSPLDALVFTGGIGEKSALIRSKILSHMKSLGTIQVNEDLNLQNSFQITEHHQEDGNGSSSVKVFVIPTNEELQIAIETAELINLTSAPPNSSS
jgi:acetate kinase